MVIALIGSADNEMIEKGEILGFLNQAQSVVGSLLFDVDREFFATTYTVAATNGTADYQMPADLRQITRVTYNGVECSLTSIRDLERLSISPYHRAMKGFQQFYSYIGGTLGRTKITLYPTPDDTTNIKVWYYRKPTEFHPLGTYNGLITTSTSATAFSDTAAPFAGTTGAGMDTFWVDATFMAKTGAAKNQKVRVVSWDASANSFVIEALTDAPGTVEYELDQVSIIPDQFHHLISYYAAFIAATKLNIPSPWMEQFRYEMDTLGARWVNNIKANLPGEVKAGVAPMTPGRAATT